jgi:thiol-disulfide isomerase/thioredoxin
MLEMKKLQIFAGLIVLSLVLLYFYGNRIRSSYEPFASGNAKFTMYYVDWCGHCKQAKPDFTEFMKKSPLTINGKSVDIAMVNPEKTPQAAAGKPVKGYPTILLEKSSGEIVEYPGERNSTAYQAFLAENI